MKRMNFTDMAPRVGKRVENDRQPQGGVEHDNDRCGVYGCPLRADMFVDGRGTCLYHRKAYSSQKNPSDVTDRIKANAGRVKLVEVYGRAPLAPFGDTLRGVQAVPSTEPGRKYMWANLVYPEWLPIGNGESHLDWMDRARAYLLKILVQDAEVSLFVAGGSE